MAKCPKCGAEISHVVSTTIETYHYVVRLPESEEEKADPDYDSDAGLIWVDDSDWGDNVEDAPFICPKCEGEISDDPMVIKKLLEGGE